MIVITGPEDSSEYAAAQAVHDAFLNLWPDVASTPPDEELIRITASAKISGYRYSDFDVVIAARFKLGRFFRPKRVLRDQDGNRVAGTPVKVVSLVAAIEVKDHDPSRTRVTGDNVEVQYSKDGAPKWSSATDQNMGQMHALKSYFADQNAPVFVHRAVLLRGYGQAPCSGTLAREFDAAGLLTALAETANLLRAGSDLVLRAGQPMAVDRVLEAPIFRSLIPSALDRMRMDRIATRNPDLDGYLDRMGLAMLRFRGRGGTGKTIMLLQLAWRAFDERNARSLVLTYNHALASDVRRMMALLKIPSAPEEGGVAVRTVMSFMTSWLTRFGLAPESGDWMNDTYESQCQTAADMIVGGAITPADIEAIKLSDPMSFEFDYLIADEAQDWPLPELELVKALYGPGRICLADGVDQLVRGGAANWERGVPPDQRVVVPLKRCLRMKANLAVFANTLADCAGLNWRVQPNDQAGGGRIIVLNGLYEGHRELHDRLVADAAAAGNAPVDLLFCVPPTSVITDGQGGRTSTMSSTFRAWGYDVWDGVDDLTRRDFPRGTDPLRVVQYASCRGLEGWTAGLEGLDQFWRQMHSEAVRHGRTAGMADPVELEDMAAAAAWRWCLIPLSRAIDTLVISLHDPASHFSRTVLAAARQHPDLVEVVTQESGTSGHSRPGSVGMIE